MGIRWLLAATVAVLAMACATPQERAAEQQRVLQDAVNGRVVKSRDVWIELGQISSAKSTAGAIVGGVLGSQIGGGQGRVVATMAGAVAGGVIGDRNARKDAMYVPGTHFTILMENERVMSVVQPEDESLHVGDLVRLEGAGREARLVKR